MMGIHPQKREKQEQEEEAGGQRTLVELVTAKSCGSALLKSIEVTAANSFTNTGNCDAGRSTLAKGYQKGKGERSLALKFLQYLDSAVRLPANCGYLFITTFLYCVASIACGMERRSCRGKKRKRKEREGKE